MTLTQGEQLIKLLRGEGRGLVALLRRGVSFKNYAADKKDGAVEVTRTPDRRFRKPLLYPAELPPHLGEGRLTVAGRCDKGKTALDLSSRD